MAPTIRTERAEDHAAVAAVVEAAFASAAHARLVADLRASDAYRPALALVADDDGEVVGHVMATTAEVVDGPARRPVANLSPLAVRPDRQGRGIGTALVRALLARADEQGEPLVVLEGDPGFYGRCGFEPAGPLGLHVDLPGWAPPEAAQACRLAAYDPALRGRVVYPAPFAAVEEG